MYQPLDCNQNVIKIQQKQVLFLLPAQHLAVTAFVLFGTDREAGRFVTQLFHFVFQLFQSPFHPLTDGKSSRCDSLLFLLRFQIFDDLL